MAAAGEEVAGEEEEEDLAAGIEAFAEAEEAQDEPGAYPPAAAVDGDVAAPGEEAEAALEADDGDDLDPASAIRRADAAFEAVDARDEQDGWHERELLRRLRQDLGTLWTKGSFELEPFGSYVTDLGLPENDGTGRSDLDVVLLFRNARADTIESKEVRNRLVTPTIDRLGSWLRNRPGFVVKNVIRRARVPIVTFETKELSVDLSVQQPWGVLNSWHLRDLCASGWGGRLRGLAKLVKLWAKSKSVHTAKDGALSSYGYVMLVASYLQDCGALPALLPRDVYEDGGWAQSPYLTSDDALQLVLDPSAKPPAEDAKGGSCGHWREAEPAVPEGWEELAGEQPAALFRGWLDWMLDTVFAFADACPDVAGGSGAVPLERRHIVSVRGRTQEELRADTSWSNKHAEHWSPEREPVFMLIEEPLNGENVARCVKAEGFQAIRKELERARDYFNSSSDGKVKQPAFDALLKLPPLTLRSQPPDGVGVRAVPWGAAGKGKGAKGPPPWTPGAKRPLDGEGAGAPGQKRPYLGYGAPQQAAAGWAGRAVQAGGPAGPIADPRMAGALAVQRATRPAILPPSMRPSPYGGARNAQPWRPPSAAPSVRPTSAPGRW